LLHGLTHAGHLHQLGMRLLPVVAAPTDHHDQVFQWQRLTIVSGVPGAMAVSTGRTMEDAMECAAATTLRARAMCWRLPR